MRGWRGRATLPDEIQTSTPCPACHGRLYPKLLRCADCGLEVSTRYGGNEFADLEPEDLHLLRIFVVCEGRIRDMESALGVSYPTVKSRLAALRTRLGLASDVAKDKSSGDTKEKPSGDTKEKSPGDTKDAPSNAQTDPANAREALDQLADGTITYEQALAKIRALRGGGKR